MTGFNPTRRIDLTENCYGCGNRLCKICKRCHTEYCEKVLICTEDKVVGMEDKK